tara:strand:- start:3088 stop:3675 length:588 start_codon:yes stop_codon:yes gene_type:complete
MKNIFITQREVIISNETRDSLDNRWLFFMDKCYIMPVLIPNKKNILRNYISDFQCDGIILSGGGNIHSLGGDKRRDDIETLLIEYSIKKNIPLIGVCRGMQKIQDFFGISLEKVEGHVQEKQEIYINKKIHKVNSFHNYGTFQNNDNFEIWAMGKDKVIKAIKHKKFQISGIMWHPERISPNRQFDINFFREFFK